MLYGYSRDFNNRTYRRGRKLWIPAGLILLLKISDFAGFLKVIFEEVFGHQIFFAVFWSPARFIAYNQPRLYPQSQAFEGVSLCHPSNRAYHAIENSAEENQTEYAFCLILFKSASIRVQLCVGPEPTPLSGQQNRRRLGQLVR